jgi:chorismate synthase
MSSFFGHLFRVATFGESHGGGVGVIVDGCPPGLPFDAAVAQRQLDRRRPGQSSLTTTRKEGDEVEILSGLFEGRTTGAPVAMLVRNQDQRSGDYAAFKDVYRPSHADYAYDAKYGHRDWRGGGRSSARETIGRVAAGALAGVVLRELLPLARCGAVAWVESVRDILLDPADLPEPALVTEAQVDATPVRCPHFATAERMAEAIHQAKSDGDSVGGVIRCVARGVPPGLGEPIFDRLEADLAKAMLSLPATKGFEIGSGFGAARMLGSEHNDPFRAGDPVEPGQAPRPRTTANRSGGVQGGVSNGGLIDFRVAFKPPATIFKPQQTVNAAGEEVELTPKGRHDPCVLPRAVPIVEAMTRLVLVDHLLRQRALRAIGAESRVSRRGGELFERLGLALEALAEGGPSLASPRMANAPAR